MFHLLLVDFFFSPLEGSGVPTTPEEEALCEEAMEGCPVEAIGNNGEG
jgi:ferredoxin